MRVVLLVTMMAVAVSQLQAQIKSYSVMGSDAIFSACLIDDTLQSEVIPRYSSWVHFSQTWHFDVSKNIGFFAGYGVTNNGFIVRYNDSLQTKNKHRTYQLGVPAGLKFGNFDEVKPFYFFAGASIDWAFHYKEKLFYDDDKIAKFSEWFSHRVNPLQPSIFIGIALPNRYAIKIQYYFMDYMNSAFTENVGGVSIRPYGHFFHTNLIQVTYGTSITGLKR